MMGPSPRVYLLDVEGTVAPIAFVHEQLFPYARAHFCAFLEQNIAADAVVRDLMLLKKEHMNEQDPNAPSLLPPGFRTDRNNIAWRPSVGIPQVLDYVFWLMDRDRKSTALKSLQGRIWKNGFESGALQGTLFDDVPAAVERWSAKALVAIYSSGSEEAQRLVFRYSIFGDLTGLISAYFDTHVGPKQASASYAAIARNLKVDPGEVLFLSDMVPELNAAREAGCQTRLVVRDGNTPVEEGHGHGVVESFAVI
jgi:enolase-phosphatase E1